MSTWGSNFFLTISIYLNYYGINFIVDYYSALTSRNLSSLVGFFAKVYLQLGGEEEWHTGVLRHSLAGLFITFALLFRSVTPIIKKDFKNKFFLLFLEILLYSCSVLIVIMSLSRTSMLVLFMTFMLFFFIDIFSRKLKIKIVFFIFFIFLSIVAFFIVYYESNVINNIIEMLWERFFVDTKGYEARIDMYQDAINSIDRNIFLGLGFGSGAEESSVQIHNFFLNSWYQLGILGLLLAVLLYSALLIFWIQQIVRLVIRPHFWLIGVSPEPIMALPILPLTRMLVGGSPFQTVLEWFSLGMFLGFALANQRMVRYQNNRYTVLMRSRS